ncbi:hypothetical protein BRC97_10640 [Halobacteriales archaeon QS_6_71_20]|nr:MAG: hypothetical protein BRC97_10640 [Halobacteriales archaeon QS_6_71_20]
MYAMVLVWVGCALVGLVLLQRAARVAVGSEAATAVADGGRLLGVRPRVVAGDRGDGPATVAVPARRPPEFCGRDPQLRG